MTTRGTHTAVKPCGSHLFVSYSHRRMRPSHTARNVPEYYHPARCVLSVSPHDSAPRCLVCVLVRRPLPLTAHLCARTSSARDCATSNRIASLHRLATRAVSPVGRRARPTTPGHTSRPGIYSSTVQRRPFVTHAHANHARNRAAESALGRDSSTAAAGRL